MTELSPAESVAAAAAGSGPGSSARRTPRGYPLGLAGMNFGVYLALLTPVLVSMTFRIQSLSGSPEATARNLGLVLGVGALFALVANPLTGRLSDRTTSRFGMRRPWILGGTAVGVAALATIGLASSIWMVLLGWCLAQTALNGALAAANATLPDQVPDADRGRVSGLVGITTPLAILTGSLLISRLDDQLLRFIVPGLILAGLAVLFVLTLPDRVLGERPAQKLGVLQFLGSFVFNPAKHPDFGWTWLTKFFVMFAYTGVNTFLPLHLTQTFGLDEQTTLNTILLANLASTGAMVVSSPVAGILSDRIGKRRPFVTAAGLVMVVGLVLLALAPNVGLLILAQGIVGLGAGSFFSVDLAMATQVLPNPQDAAKDLGVLNIANALPQSIAPAIAPAVIALGASTPLGGYPTWFLLGAVVAFLGAVLVYRIKGVR